MNYFVAIEVESGVKHLCEYKDKVAKNEYVVVPNACDEPVTAKVHVIVTRYKALTSGETITKVIGFISTKTWRMEQEKELENQILLSKMQEKINEIKLVDTLEKFAGKNDEMSELLREYRRAAGTEEYTE